MSKPVQLDLFKDSQAIDANAVVATNSVQLDLFKDLPANSPVNETPSPKHNALTVYRASAGSGKTYTLTFEYLKQALSDGYNTNKFRTILAVTFTNKATDEMKIRILTTLNNIVNDRDYTVRDSLCRELNIDKYTLKDRAKRVQQAILHNYSNFSISTIDKFFQKIVHAFVREAGLHPGFRLELDHDRLMDEAVDRMMLNLHTKKFLYTQMSNIIDEQMEKGRAWDIRKTLKDKGGEVLKEQFRALGYSFRSKINDSEFIENFEAVIGKIINDFENHLASLARSAISIIDSYDLQKSNFYYGKNGPVNYFYKLQKGNYEIPGKWVYKILENNDDEAWCGGNVSEIVKNDIQQISGTLTLLLEKAVTFYEEKHRQYFTAVCIRKAMGHLKFFAEIETNIREIANDENLMPISETVHLLSKLVNESDSPFIYEMTGSRYDVFMIDEFQDTSEAQWQNFKPLLKNSLSEGKDSLIVGDVKQSIYRWRNGDWRILANKIFNEFGNFAINEKNLDTNWRSFPNIVEFNNALFSALPAYVEKKFAEDFELPNADFEIDILSSAYKNAEQKVAEANRNKSGYVSISLFRDEKNEQEVKIKANDKILKQLPELIAGIQDRGYKAKDIAILVRKTGEGQAISDCLLNHKRTSGDAKHCFDIVSKDALFIKNSATAEFIISLLRTVVNPDDKINNASINYFMNRNCPDFKWNGSDVLDDEVKEKLSGLSSLSLPEVFERLVRAFDLGGNPVDLPYIQELHDMLISFSNNEISDIPSFIEHWDDNSDKKSLSEGQTPDAINITTIHRAKGLEYPVVILPFCNWEMKPSYRDTIWVAPTNEPFNQLPHVLLNYSNAMQNSYFDNEYYYETIQSLVDNLNLMYVAFTRAKEELYIMLPLPQLPKSQNTEPDDIRKVSSVLSTFLKSNPNFLHGKLKVKRLTGDDLLYASGEQQRNRESREDEKFTGIFVTNYTSSAFDKKLRLKYESEDYFPEQGAPLQSKNYGILMHKAFSLIRSAKDAPAAIERIEKDGLIKREHVPELKTRVEKALRFAEKWFADDNVYKIITEKSLLLPASMNKGASRRPDRIMLSKHETLIVDYKFGVLKKDSHITQVKNYVQLLETMKYPDVKGYVWYVDMDSIVEVN
ncbi:MAG: UvrD-helicase domain-containing protein [Prevotellaceae bacterium]|jgi:ATP-dependent exoDNAse (exonuclease V) beta subunit|nr:UvrD-helicase domain-containing protein [Prevotellaceae bacterium]